MGYGRKTEKEAALTSFAEFNALVKQCEQERRDAWEIARWQEWFELQMNPYIKKPNKPRTPKSMMTFPWEAEDEASELTPEMCHIDADTLEKLEAMYQDYYKKQEQVN